jgi:uncharacterized RDD family membrane protein YckC
VIDSAAQLPVAGVGRRLGAMLYDTLLVIAVLAVAGTLPFLPFLHGRVLVPSEAGRLAWLYWGWEIVVIAAFFGFFWTRSGQTLGMLVWRLRLVRADGRGVTWGDALLRLGILAALLAPFFVGDWLFWRHWRDPTAHAIARYASLAPILLSYAWIWIDRERLAWHDRWSSTRVVVLPKRS